MTEFLSNEGRLSPLAEGAPLILSPDEARMKLQGLGFSLDHFNVLLAGNENSDHFVYALAVISSGTETRNINDVYHDLYPETEKAHLTAADVEADHASQRAWEAIQPSLKEK